MRVNVDRHLAGVPAPADGLVVVDKEAGWTSHDVVDRCRRIFGQRRVGHAGTLDPGATGVLLVGIGRVTRLLRYLSVLGKSYTAEVVLGTATSTDDDEGEIRSSWEMASIPLEEVMAAAARLTGEIEQVPPMVSARHVGGRRLYALARQGIEIERGARRVMVSRLEVSSLDGNGANPAALRPGEQAVAIEVDCSQGTYVRALARDLGAALGGGAHLRCLRRTSVGPFGIGEARLVEDVASDVASGRCGCVLTPAQAMRAYPLVHLPASLCEGLRHGRAFEREALGEPGSTRDGPWAVADEDGALLAVCTARGDGLAAPDVVLAPGAEPGSCR